MVTADEQLKEIETRLGRLKTEEARFKPQAEIKLTRKLTLGRANIARQVAARRQEARGFLKQIGREKTSLLEARTKAEEVRRIQIGIEQKQAALRKRETEIKQARKLIAQKTFDPFAPKGVRKLLVQAEEERLEIDRLKKEFADNQAKLIALEREGLLPIFGKEGQVTGFTAAVRPGEGVPLRVEDLGLIGAESLGRLQKAGVVEVAKKQSVTELGPRFITSRQETKSQRKTLGDFFRSDIPLPIIAGVPGGRTTVREFAEALREVPISIPIFVGPGGKIRTTFPSKVIAELIPTTPGEAAIFTGITLLGFGAAGRVVQVITSGVVGGLGLGVAASKEFTPAQRVAGGLVGVAGLAGLATRLPIFKRTPRVRGLGRGVTRTPLDKTFRATLEFDKIPAVRDIAISRAGEAGRVRRAGVAAVERVSIEKALRDVSARVTPEITRRQATIRGVLEQERIRVAQQKVLQSVVRAKAGRLALREVLPEPRILALRRVRGLPREPKAITFEVQRPLVTRFDIVGKRITPKKLKPTEITIDPALVEELRFQTKQPKRFDIVGKSITPKKIKPLRVGLDPRLIEKIKFEKAQPTRFDIPGVSRQQLLLKRPKVVRPKALVRLEFKPIELAGVQKLALRRARPRVRRARRQAFREPRLAPIPEARETLKGIPRAMGGEGISEAELAFVRAREVSIFRAGQRQRFARTDLTIQAERLAQPLVLRQRSLLLPQRQ